MIWRLCTDVLNSKGVIGQGNDRVKGETPAAGGQGDGYAYAGYSWTWSVPRGSRTIASSSLLLTLVFSPRRHLIFCLLQFLMFLHLPNRTLLHFYVQIQHIPLSPYQPTTRAAVAAAYCASSGSRAPAIGWPPPNTSIRWHNSGHQDDRGACKRQPCLDGTSPRPPPSTDSSSLVAAAWMETTQALCSRHGCSITDRC